MRVPPAFRVWDARRHPHIRTLQTSVGVEATRFPPNPIDHRDADAQNLSLTGVRYHIRSKMVVGSGGSPLRW